MLTGQNGSGRVFGDVEASTDASITTAMDRIWEEEQKGTGVSFRWCLQQQSAMLSDTHLDCGNESVLSFNSSSETSVSRISGLDLLPYLRHRKRRVDDQAEGESMLPPKLGCFINL